MSGSAALAPFRTRSFRFQWPADLFTAWALEMETLILGWFVLVETGSVLLLTVFGSLQFVGTLISPMLGVLADRIGLRNVLTAMRFCYAAFAGVLLAMAIAGKLEPMAVFLVAALSGLLKPSDIGMRSALVGATIPSSHVVAAMGISRTTQDTARVVGALAGAGLIAAYGMVPAFTVITAVYLVGALLTLLVDARPGARPAAIPGTQPVVQSSPWRDLREGLAYVWHTPRLRAAMSLAALVNLTAFPLTGALMPYIARDVFHLDQKGLGLLVASFASGAFIGSVTLSLLGGRVQPARMMLAAAITWYLALIGFVLAETLALAMALLLVAGMAQSLSMVTLAIMLIRTSEERFRGRIMGVRMLAIYTLPIGLLFAGWLIPQVGYQATALGLVITGLLLTLEIAVSWRRDLIRTDAVANGR